MKHRLRRNPKNNKILEFSYNNGCNGAQCEACGRTFCTMCQNSGIDGECEEPTVITLKVKTARVGLP